jgi:hypothetical protein
LNLSVASNKAHSIHLGSETRHTHLSDSCLAAYTIWNNNKFAPQHTIKDET